MQLQNSYIFLPNPFKNDTKRPVTKKRENVIRIRGSSVSSFIKKIFPFAEKATEYDNIFKHKYICTITNKDTHYTAEFIINEVVEKIYFDAIVEGKNKAQLVEKLEYIQSAMQDSGIQSDYVMIISYDAVSEYYCNKVYTNLNKLERNLRKLLFNIYIVNLGLDYYQKTISTELQDKAKTVIQAKGHREKKETERLQKFFYSLEFNDIQNLLFTPRWTSIEEKAKCKFLADNKNLAKLSDEDLRKAFLMFTPKSDWERFFSGKFVGLNVQEVIESIRKQRNNIAHCKFFYKSDYILCNKSINDLNKAIVAAIKITEEKDFISKNVERVKTSLATSFDSMSKTIEPFLQSVIPQLQNIIIPQLLEKICEVMNPINTNDYFSSMLSGLRSFDTYSKDYLADNDNNIDSTDDTE